ncbi:MAG: ferrous iron transport protein A [Gammaproteobacteria bacterium]|jgi:ferrous iron transport protein A
MTLKDLRRGDRVRISSVDPADPGVQRLMMLGLVEGTELTFLHSSLGGDPLEFRVHGTSISMRQDQARRFRVEPLDGNDR